jgi:hypothetical protein
LGFGISKEDEENKELTFIDSHLLLDSHLDSRFFSSKSEHIDISFTPDAEKIKFPFSSNFSSFISNSGTFKPFIPFEAQEIRTRIKKIENTIKI